MGGGGGDIIAFPSNPVYGDLYTYGSRTYIWEGNFWRLHAQFKPTISGGTTGQVLVSNGITNPASFQTISAGPTPVSVSSDITLAKGNRYFVDTSAARTLTLPASPTMGDEIQVFDATGTAGTNNITIANNSLKINGVTDSAVLDVDGVAVVFIYTGTTYGWRMG